MVTPLAYMVVLHFPSQGSHKPYVASIGPLGSLKKSWPLLLLNVDMQPSSEEKKKYHRP